MGTIISPSLKIALDGPSWGLRQNFAVKSGTEKLEWWGYQAVNV